MSRHKQARRTLKLRPKADAASDVRTRPTAESGGALAVQTPSTARGAPRRAVSGRPRASAAEPESSRERRPRERREGTTTYAVSTTRRAQAVLRAFLRRSRGSA